MRAGSSLLQGKWCRLLEFTCTSGRLLIMTQAYDDVRLASAYHSGNEMPDASLHAWVDFIVEFAPNESLDVLDLGAGSGMFSAGLARHARASSVIGVEPSDAMRAEAVKHSAANAVTYVAGSADSIPASDGTFDLVLISRVIHHVRDRVAAAQELARVLRPDGVVVIRTTFSEALDAVVYEFWPALLRPDRERFSTRADLLADFAEAGFEVREVTSFAQPVTSSLHEYYTRLTTRPQSKFDQLSSAEYDDGLARLRVAVDDELIPQPVSERYDVVVLALP